MSTQILIQCKILGVSSNGSHFGNTFPGRKATVEATCDKGFRILKSEHKRISKGMAIKNLLSQIPERHGGCHLSSPEPSQEESY